MIRTPPKDDPETISNVGTSNETGSDRPVQPAATMVVAREGLSGPEVLVLRRSVHSRFAPGYVVFPGGSVESEDADLAARWFGDANDAFRACAVRELAEETALAVTSEGVVGGASSGTALGLVNRNPPPASAVAEMARWFAPPIVPRRFDARFFVVAAGQGVDAVPDGDEIEDASWARPSDILAANVLWKTLMWPTFRTLQHLTACSSLAEILRLRIEQDAPPPELARLRPPEWGGS